MIILVNNNESGEEAVVGWVETRTQAEMLVNRAEYHQKEVESFRMGMRERASKLTEYINRNKPDNKHPGKVPNPITPDYIIRKNKFEMFMLLVVEKQLDEKQIREYLINKFETEFPQYKSGSKFTINDTLMRIHGWTEVNQLDVQQILKEVNNA
jgi:hypothetical protein